MYESALENVKSSFQPLVEFAELNRKTLEKITSVQTSYLTDCISTSIEQVKSLAGAGSAQRATELSFEAAKQFESKLNGATEQNLAALKELRDGVNSLVNNSCTGNYARVTEMYNLKDTLESFTSTATAAFKPAVKAAPVKTAAVKKTPAKKAAPKAATKPAVKAAAKPVTKPAVKAAAKPAVKAAAKPAVTATAKPAAKVAAKPAIKATAKPVAKKPTVQDAIVEKLASEKKAPVKRAAAKPAVKKATAKPVASTAPKAK